MKIDVKYILVFMVSGVAALLFFDGFKQLLPPMTAWQMIAGGIILLIIAHQYLTRRTAFYDWRLWLLLVLLVVII